MIPEAVWNAVPNKNPVEAAAERLGHNSDEEFLRESARGHVAEDIAEMHIEAYCNTREERRPKIPFFCIPSIVETLTSTRNESVKKAADSEEPPADDERPTRRSRKMAEKKKAAKRHH